MKKVFIFFLICICFGKSVTAQYGTFSDTLQRLNALVASWNTATPGGVLTIMRGSAVLYNQAGGMADLEHHIANTTETVFEAGSVSKQFTATAVLMLADEGKLSLEDDVRKYIPELPDYDGAVIRIKNLLVHTSGLKDWGSVAMLGGWPRTTRAYTQDHAREIIFRQKTLNFSPGAEYSYSNSNYTLLATLVERISGQSLVDFTRERILMPAGMTHTQWRDDFRRIVPDRAVAYEKRQGEYIQMMPFENTHGHGALLTNTRDLLTWLRYWAGSGFGKTLSGMRETQGVLNDGSIIGYAGGAVFVGRVNGVREVSHSGATAGYRAWLAYYPSQDLSVAYLSNDGSISPTSSMGKKISEIFFGGGESSSPETAAPEHTEYAPTSSLNAYVGRYYSEEADALLEVRIKGDTLEVFRRPASTYALKAVSADVFEFANGLSLRFTRNRRNKVTGFAASVERARNVRFNKLP